MENLAQHRKLLEETESEIAASKSQMAELRRHHEETSTIIDELEDLPI